MSDSENTKGRPFRLESYVWFLAVVWTVVIAASLVWNVVQIEHNALKAARIQARIAYEKDVISRSWNARHGVVYVPVTETTQPNPYLSHIPERDITTPSGKQLTLINPAYMTRQLHELAEAEHGVRGHITSLNPIRPENAPDPWESKALRAFERGQTEISSVEEMEGQEYMRLMRPLVTEKSCLKCHAAQGYREGDTRGGISVSIPMGSLWVAARRNMLMLVLGHALLWLTGLQGFVWGRRRLRKSESERNRAEEALEKANKELEIKVEERTAELRENNEQLAKEVTERKRAEKEQQRAREAAEMANRAKSAFLANMSHELRTPLNGILGFSELLAQEELTDEQKEFVDIIGDSGKSLLTIIQDILDFSRIEAGKLETEILTCSPEEILSGVDSLLRPEAVKKGLGFEISLASEVPAVIRTDPTRVRQCLLNLVNNAIKFTESGHIHLRVSLEKRGDNSFIRFDVEDTGIGISADKQELIFESFSQADGSNTRKYEGTGLGLAITKRLAEMLGGDIRVQSQLGQGSVFSLIIPAGVEVESVVLLDKKDLLSQQKLVAEPHSQRVLDSLEGLSASHVLLAEDNPTNQKFIEVILKKMGLQTTAVEDGRQAVDKAASESFDLILMDMQMPVMNGYEATRALREKDITVPIIALTAYAMESDAQKCLQAGCDDYLAKPFGPDKLIEIVSKHLKAASFMATSLAGLAGENQQG